MYLLLLLLFFISVLLFVCLALNECIEGDVPGWLVKGRTILVIKDPEKSAEVSVLQTYSLPHLIWNLIRGVKSNKTYGHLEKYGLLP